MGLQSLPFYILSTWLPDMEAAEGLDQVTGGWMLSLIQLTSLPATIITPIVAMRMLNRGIIGIISGVLLIIGTTGLGFGSTSLVPLWMLLSLGTGMAVSFAMLTFGLRTENAQQAADLSGMAQSFGYLLAAIGPILIGIIQEITNSWTIPKLVLILISVLLLLSGMWVGQRHPVLKKTQIGSEQAFDVIR